MIIFFNLLETFKNNKLDFSDIITLIFDNTNRIEASFSSKLLATIDPNYPVWDKYVLLNLGLKAPSYSGTTPEAKRKRIIKIIGLHNSITEWYSGFLGTENAKSLIRCFDAYYKNVNITDSKKIDLILWKLRD